MVKGALDGEVENNFKPMAEGIYQGRVTNLEIRTSKNGNDYINIEFSLQNNRKAWDRLMFHSDGCLNVSKGKLEGLGFTRDERKQLDPDYLDSIVSAIKSIITGKTYDIKIGIKDGQNEVKYYNDANASDDTATEQGTTAPW